MYSPGLVTKRRVQLLSLATSLHAHGTGSQFALHASETGRQRPLNAGGRVRDALILRRPRGVLIRGLDAAQRQREAVDQASYSPSARL
jgi:hypothetical protein